MFYLTEEVFPRKRTNDYLIDSLWDLWRPRKRLRWPTEEDDFDDLNCLSIEDSLPKPMISPENKCLTPNTKSDKFSVKLDVNHFKPEEIEIKVVGNDLIISGKHEERKDNDNAFVSRQFSRRYEVPNNCDLDLIMSSLSKDCKLTIEAPFKSPEKVVKESVVPIAVEDNPKRSLTTTITRAEEECDQIDVKTK